MEYKLGSLAFVVVLVGHLTVIAQADRDLSNCKPTKSVSENPNLSILQAIPTYNYESLVKFVGYVEFSNDHFYSGYEKLFMPLRAEEVSHSINNKYDYLNISDDCSQTTLVMHDYGPHIGRQVSEIRVSVYLDNGDVYSFNLKYPQIKSPYDRHYSCPENRVYIGYSPIEEQKPTARIVLNWLEFEINNDTYSNERIKNGEFSLSEYKCW